MYFYTAEVLYWAQLDFTYVLLIQKRTFTVRIFTQGISYADKRKFQFHFSFVLLGTMALISELVS